MGVINKCDICLHPEGFIKTFNCYQTSDSVYEKREVCEKCVSKLVEKYFCKVHTPW